MKTTSTGSPKVSKTTSTAKRGRPVGSKKSIRLPEYPEVEKFITGKIKEEIRIDKALEHEKKFLDDYYRVSKKALEHEKKFLADYYRGLETGEKTGNDKPFMFSEKQQKAFVKKVKEAYNLDMPDAQATVEQVKDWSRFKPQGEVVETKMTFIKWLQGRPESTRLEMYIGIFIGVLIANVIIELLTNL
jgi:hypothetical protein